MAKHRIVQRRELFFVQKRIFFIWFYETKPANYWHELHEYVEDDEGFLAFADFVNSKEYLHAITNIKTKVVYELHT